MTGRRGECFGRVSVAFLWAEFGGRDGVGSEEGLLVDGVWYAWCAVLVCVGTRK